MTRGATVPRPMSGRHGWARRYQVFLALTDALVLILVMAAAHGVRFGFDPAAPVAGPAAPPYWFVSLAIGAAWFGLLAWTRSREPRVLGHGPQEFQRIVSASWMTFTAVAVVGFLTQWQISRGYLLFAAPVGIFMLLLYRAAWRYWIHVERDAGRLQAAVLVVGPQRTVRQMIERLASSRRAGYQVVGAFLSGNAAEHPDAVEGVPVLGTPQDASRVAREMGVDYVLLAGSEAMSLRESRRLGWELEGSGVELIVAPSLVDVAGPRMQFSPVEGLPLMHVDEPTFSGGKYVLKSALDRVLALVVLVVLAPVFAVIAVAVAVSSPGPVLFRQERVGRDLRRFSMLKFRSMYTDAQHRLEALRDSQSAGNEVMFKMKQDPRVTPVGRVLRRFSLDELPQVVNVLRGEMSFVGPRPPLPAEVDSWEGPVERRQLVKPGLTGLWQVSGRSDLTWDESVRLDLYYTENWSIGGDLVIVLRTVWAVLAGRGAY